MRALERRRTEGTGPKYQKPCGRVLYRLVDIKERESTYIMSTIAVYADAAGICRISFQTT